MANIANSNVVPDEAPTFNIKPLMFETFVCTMAVMAFSALAGPVARVTGLEAWQIGTAMTAAGLAWVLMARFWGRLSDKRGRRPIILFGLSGFVISYASLALFIDFAMQAAVAPIITFIGLVVGRGIAGVFYAAVPATSAALIADHVPPKQRTAAMAGIGAASAAGMVIGPGFVGLIGAYSLSIPLYFTAILPAIALLALWRVLPKVKLHAKPDMQSVSLTDKRLRRPVAVAFVAAFSVSIAQVIVGFFILDRLQLDTSTAARSAGIALAVVGIALIVAQVAVQKLMWQPQRFILFGGLIAAAGFIVVYFSLSSVILWIGYGLAGFGMGWVYPSLSALAANSVEAHEQGAAAGTVSSAQGLGIVVGPIVGTAIYGLDYGLPFALIAAMLILAAIWRSPK
ncbi:MFS transporter [Pseudoalteromonas umbrosa]|uniref:MFS transporter n=1 Tax=Pseudoalteromonas umbrosa TaxID=3048489 RepID=UPI0024C3E640|nr:MFS transporter [Pseudoalteromonas sp. B95]MDK1288268.1 MFS transporter [Pseudoalteromonas sp. B95]